MNEQEAKIKSYIDMMTEETELLYLKFIIYKRLKRLDKKMMKI